MLEKSLLAFALVGAHWVLYLLIALSVVSVGIMIERAIFLARRRADARNLSAQLAHLLAAGELDQARALVASQGGTETRVRLERRLLFLGTLGNNAPFVGLFGTVLGIIKAFHDLSLGDPTKAAASAQVVMAGVSEALVATAVGLAVALPAVVAFNYFKSMVKGMMASAESLSKLVDAHEVK